MKMGRNDPCWCGSGKKYKHCHLGRSQETALPLGAIVDHARRYFRVKECLHPEASHRTCGKVIGAHTIQRQGALRHIIDKNGHCLSFFPPSLPRAEEPRKVGWRQASVFPGFCDKHDTAFAPIETAPFAGTPEQCFLLAYRAECHEFYQKQASARAQKQVSQELDRGKGPEEQVVIQSIQGTLGRDIAKGLLEAQQHKRQMDQEFLTKRYDSYSSFFVCFEGPASIVGTGAATPNRSLSGRELQKFRSTASIQRLYPAFVCYERGAAAVFVWRTADSAPSAFIEELRHLDQDKLPGIIAQFMLAYVENTYFSTEWWTSLSHDEQCHVRDLALLPDPYFMPWNYRKGLSVPWAVRTVAQVWPNL